MLKGGSASISRGPIIKIVHAGCSKITLSFTIYPSSAMPASQSSETISVGKGEEGLE